VRIAVLSSLFLLAAGCAHAQTPAAPGAAPAPDRLARVRRELEARYDENARAFIAQDTAAVYALRAADFHTETPDGRTHTFADMRAYTERLFAMIERFDTLTFRIDSLSLRGDTAVAVVFQRSSRLQHLPGTPAGELHRVSAAVIQREQWVRGPTGWLLWRVDQVRDQGLWIDGELRRRPGG
jgi:hypothetical protein